MLFFLVDMQGPLWYCIKDLVIFVYSELDNNIWCISLINYIV